MWFENTKWNSNWLENNPSKEKWGVDYDKSASKLSSQINDLQNELFQLKKDLDDPKKDYEKTQIQISITMSKIRQKDYELDKLAHEYKNELLK